MRANRENQFPSIGGSVTPDSFGTSFYMDLTVPEVLSWIITNSALTPYEMWSVDHAGDQSPSEDYDKDGVPNGVEFFMDAQDGFTASPGIVDGHITWPYGNVTTYKVQVSGDLVHWQNVPQEQLAVVLPSANAIGSVTYSMPAGITQFVRLVVTP